MNRHSQGVRGGGNEVKLKGNLKEEGVKGKEVLEQGGGMRGKR